MSISFKTDFSKEWDNCYRNETQISIWPWSDMVSLVHRHCKSIIETGTGRVLELGCGAGANIPLFLALGLDYKAIEGSPTIVAQLHQRYPELANNIRVGDFTTDETFDGAFDLVIDRAAVTHNSTESIRNALQYSFDILRPGGIFIGSDWFSTKHADYSGGEMAADEYTRKNYKKGQFVGVGDVHFSDESHIRNLFSKFEILFLEEKLTQRYEPKDKHQFASWNIVAKR